MACRVAVRISLYPIRQCPPHLICPLFFSAPQRPGAYIWVLLGTTSHLLSYVRWILCFIISSKTGCLSWIRWESALASSTCLYVNMYINSVDFPCLDVITWKEDALPSSDRIRVTAFPLLQSPWLRYRFEQFMVVTNPQPHHKPMTITSPCNIPKHVTVVALIKHSSVKVITVTTKLTITLH